MDYIDLVQTGKGNQFEVHLEWAINSIDTPKQAPCELPINSIVFDECFFVEKFSP